MFHGMTVRVLLGNLPELAVFRFADQIHYVIVDLRNAGIDRGEDPEIGWKLEVANYLGNLPHAHSKFVVVDGRTAVAAGFNYSYLHLEKDYPSDLALGMTDMGLQMTGPIAQTVMAAYDDLWLNSESVTCIGRPPFSALLFSFLCESRPSEVTHVPEVLRFYPVEPESDFSAWGSPSLTEYNIATDDPKAVEEFLTEYEYWWDQGVPVEDIMGQQDILAEISGQ